MTFTNQPNVCRAARKTIKRFCDAASSRFLSPSLSSHWNSHRPKIDLNSQDLWSKRGEKAALVQHSRLGAHQVNHQRLHRHLRLQRWQSLLLWSGTDRQLFQSTWRQSTTQKTLMSSRKLNSTSVSFLKISYPHVTERRWEWHWEFFLSGKPSKGGVEAGYKDWMFMNYTFKRWILNSCSTHGRGAQLNSCCFSGLKVKVFEQQDPR